MRDVILVGHGFTDIPPQYFTYTSMFILFKTVENISRRKNVILNYDKIKQAVDRVNRIAETNHHYKEEFYV